MRGRAPSRGARALHASVVMRPHHPVARILTFSGVIVTALLACGPDGQPESIRAAEEQALEEETAHEPAAAPETRNSEPPEIYYDLTRFEWYRRGQPLLVGGRPFQPAGRPEPTGAREFTELGRYEGVTYYVVAGSRAPHDVVYVPVSPGYWQPFVHVGAGAPVDGQSADGASD